jgi:transcriptional regulator with XRE-family HTH domain
MAEKREKDAAPAPQQTLGEFLSYVRMSKKMTLREVEEATGGAVSNAYLSQLEKGRISKPSPNILHALSDVYAISYERLMEKAGYLAATASKSSTAKHGRAATFADEHLTQTEEEELLRYLAFLRSQARRQK